MDHLRIAARIVESRRKGVRPEVEKTAKPSVLIPSTEYSCHMTITLSSDFEGDVSKTDLIKKLKSEIVASLKAGMKQVAKDLGIHNAGVVVQPLRVECAVVDQMDMEDVAETSEPFDVPMDPEPEPPAKKRKKRGR